MDDLTAAGPALLALFGMIFAAAVAGPRVVWVRGSFGIHYQSSLRWPPVRPENLDHRYRYDDWHTKFQTILGAVLAVGLNQQLWSAHPWWVFASAAVIASLRSLWMRQLIGADGGLSRPRNPTEQILLWSALVATLLIDVTVVASTAWHTIA